MLKPIMVQDSLSRRIEPHYVLVHPGPMKQAGGGWSFGVTIFDGNGKWQSSSSYETQPEARKEAAALRRRLRQIHKKNVKKWAKFDNQ